MLSSPFIKPHEELRSTSTVPKDSTVRTSKMSKLKKNLSKVDSEKVGVAADMVEGITEVVDLGEAGDIIGGVAGVVGDLAEGDYISAAAGAISTGKDIADAAGDMLDSAGDILDVGGDVLGAVGDVDVGGMMDAAGGCCTWLFNLFKCDCGCLSNLGED
ncbi:unnamed protein product [Orchesella dallaii]|uniref:Uncharacterized protein n=1 Tax=Orchesella dallaii TaxID=48710 RepID=A0ABP1RHP1_9HEXA